MTEEETRADERERAATYLRAKATKIRERYDGNRMVRDGERERLPTDDEIATAQDIARQLDIAGDEIESAFHIGDG